MWFSWLTRYYMDHSTISQKGGIATKAKYGQSHYIAIGKSGARANYIKYGSKYYLELSRKGVEARLAKLKKKALDQDNSIT